jgi:hypothetical protein
MTSVNHSATRFSHVWTSCEGPARVVWGRREILRFAQNDSEGGEEQEQSKRRQRRRREGDGSSSRIRMTVHQSDGAFLRCPRPLPHRYWFWLILGEVGYRSALDPSARFSGLGPGWYGPASMAYDRACGTGPAWVGKAAFHIVRACSRSASAKVSLHQENRTTWSS